MAKRVSHSLLDHFTDPLSFSYWAIGLAVSCDRLDLGIAAILWIYATAVMTSIKAKLVGEFTLARIGPTELKAVLALYGVGIAILTGWPGGAPVEPHLVALGFLWFAVVAGIAQLLVGLVRAIRAVNAQGAAPDTSGWELTGEKKPGPAGRR